MGHPVVVLSARGSLGKYWFGISLALSFPQPADRSGPGILSFRSSAPARPSDLMRVSPRKVGLPGAAVLPLRAASRYAPSSRRAPSCRRARSCRKASRSILRCAAAASRSAFGIQ